VLAAHGHRVTDLAELTGGFGGTNLLAATPDGPLVVKVRREAGPLRVIRTVSGTLTHRGVPHPDVLLPPVATDAGWILGLRWIGGRSLVDAAVPEWTPAQAARFGAALGRWMRRLHTVRMARRTWRSRAERRYDQKTDLCRRAGLVVGRLARQVAGVWDAHRGVLDTAPLTLVHRDLQPGNLLVDDTARFAAVIDFEQARLADPLYDFVKLDQWVFPLHPGIAPALRAAYGLDLADGAVRARLTLVTLIELLSMVNYFHENGRPELADDKREHLRRLVGGG
jgi:aminoglycoside phosphotransferase (APT) family kinase protein